MPHISTFIKDVDDTDHDVGIKSSLFYNQLLPFELKAGSLDPFSDPPPDSSDRHQLSFCKEGNPERLARGQIAGVFTEMFACRFRTHAFSVFINHHTARFLRADLCSAYRHRARHRHYSGICRRRYYTNCKETAGRERIPFRNRGRRSGAILTLADNQGAGIRQGQGHMDCCHERA